MAGLAPSLPLRLSKEDGHQLIKSFEELTQQNLKMLVLTNPGERMMDPEFGVGLRKFLFEHNSATTHGEIRGRISEQVGAYLPFIKILNIDFKVAKEIEYSGNVLNVRIDYFITPLQVRSMIDVMLELSEFDLESFGL
tara:strand:+ start:6 stop:419 length:414 start_codon:yes stop_codon:yes gene_type:complete